ELAPELDELMRALRRDLRQPPPEHEDGDDEDEDQLPRREVPEEGQHAAHLSDRPRRRVRLGMASGSARDRPLAGQRRRTVRLGRERGTNSRAMVEFLGLLFVLLAVSWIAVPILLARLFGRVERLEKELASLRAREKGATAPVLQAAKTEPAQPKPTIPDPWEDDELPATVVTPPRSAPPPIAAPPIAAPPRAVVPPASKPPLDEPRAGRIEWERWLGVRGAGVLGGVFAALAAVLLFRHA